MVVVAVTAVGKPLLYQWQLPGFGWPVTKGTPVGLICIAINTAGFPKEAFVAL